MNKEEQTRYPDDYIVPPMDEYAGLPPIEIQQAIAEAVHTGVLLEKAGHTLNRCLLYAGVAAAIGYAFTGRKYMITCGYTCINKHKGKLYLADPRLIKECRTGVQHCWATFSHGERLEIVDLSSRNFTKHAKQRLELDWNWSPNFIWSFMDEIPKKYQLMFVCDPTLTQLLIADLATRHLSTCKRIYEIAFSKMLEAGFTISPEAISSSFYSLGD